MSEDNPTLDEVSQVLTCVLNHVIGAVNESKQLSIQIEDMKCAIDENEQHYEHARKMNDFLTNEARRLLLIGNRTEAQNVTIQLLSQFFINHLLATQFNFRSILKTTRPSRNIWNTCLDN